jgi:N-acylneuraminate cytidylyltransferase
MGEKNQKIIALLPMKSHSERIPNKNVRLFSGKPLLRIVIDTLLGANYIENIVVNTDSAEISNIISKYYNQDIIIHERPEVLCGDMVSMNDIINYDIAQLAGEHFLQTHSTNPLLRSKTIDSAIRKYFDNIDTFDSIFSVTRLQTRLFDKNVKPLNHKFGDLIRTQDLEPIYEENSNFYIFSKNSFKSASNNRIGLNAQMHELNKMEAQDIDEEEDFVLAESIYNRKYSKLES